MELITKALLKEKAEARLLEGKPIYVEPVDVTQPIFSSRLRGSKAYVEAATQSDIALMDATGKLADAPIVVTGKFRSGFDVPMKSGLSVNQMVARGMFKGNSLADNWQDYMDAMRIDLTIRKAALPTIRQYFYNILPRPNASYIVKPTELYPYGIVFDEHNGEGQAVKQGQAMSGADRDIQMKIYAASWQYSLLMQLFDRQWDLSRLNDGVMVGHNAKKDNLAISPILNANYAGIAGSQTPASAEGDNRQEKLWNTLLDAVDDLGARLDPVTGRRIGANDCILLGSTYDAKHAQMVLGGLPSDRNRRYGPIPGIRAIVAYDDEVIELPNETFTYSGCTDGTMYLIQRNRYMNIVEKRGLVTEIDPTPDVKTLAREERAWWFSEGLDSYGVSYFVQKITLPDW